MQWQDVALLLFIGVAMVWFAFDRNGGTSVTKLLFAPFEMLFVPVKAIQRMADDETASPVLRSLARLACKIGFAFVFLLIAVVMLLYALRRFIPRHWH